MAWLNVLGLIFNLVGSGIAAIGVIASRAAIDRMTASYYGGPNPDARADRKRQSNLAITGLGTLRLGLRGRPLWVSLHRAGLLCGAAAPEAFQL
jgi:hypothetical protein